MRRVVLFVGLVIILCWQINAQAFIAINEVLADPASGLSGDADGDGTRSSSGDEFVELVNFGETSVNLNGWSLSDSSSQRHIFEAADIIDPYGFFVVFGSTASSRGFSLNNSGDTVSLFDNNNQLIDQVVYASALGNQNQSFVRWQEGEGDFILHASIAEAANELFSPGTGVDGRLVLRSLDDDPVSSTVVPEFPAALYLFLGFITLWLKKTLIVVRI